MKTLHHHSRHSDNINYGCTFKQYDLMVLSDEQAYNLSSNIFIHNTDCENESNDGIISTAKKNKITILNNKCTCTH